MPRFSRNGRISHSSVSIDLLLTSVRRAVLLQDVETIWLCSAASRAQCTTMPLAVALRSNSSR